MKSSGCKRNEELKEISSLQVPRAIYFGLNLSLKKGYI